MFRDIVIGMLISKKLMISRNRNRIDMVNQFLIFLCVLLILFLILWFVMMWLFLFFQMVKLVWIKWNSRRVEEMGRIIQGIMCGILLQVLFLLKMFFIYFRIVGCGMLFSLYQFLVRNLFLKFSGNQWFLVFGKFVKLV